MITLAYRGSASSIITDAGPSVPFYKREKLRWTSVESAKISRVLPARPGVDIIAGGQPGSAHGKPAVVARQNPASSLFNEQRP